MTFCTGISLKLLCLSQFLLVGLLPIAIPLPENLRFLSLLLFVLLVYKDLTPPSFDILYCFLSSIFLVGFISLKDQ